MNTNTAKGFIHSTTIWNTLCLFIGTIKYFKMKKWKYKFIRHAKAWHLIAVLYGSIIIAGLVYRTFNN